MTFVKWELLLEIEDTKTLDNLDDSCLQIHGVEVEEPLAAVDELLTHFDSKLNTEFTDLLIVIFNWFDGILQKLGNISLAESYCSHKSIIAKNRHESRNDKLLDSGSLAILDPLQVNLTIVEQLGDHEIGPSITLLFEVLDVQVAICLSHVHLGIAGNHNAEIVTIALSNELNELSCISEAVFDWLPVVHASWWIASEREDVPDAILLSFVQGLDYAVPGESSAS